MPPPPSDKFGWVWGLPLLFLSSPLTKPIHTKIRTLQVKVICRRIHCTSTGVHTRTIPILHSNYTACPPSQNCGKFVRTESRAEKERLHRQLKIDKSKKFKNVSKAARLRQSLVSELNSKSCLFLCSKWSELRAVKVAVEHGV